MTELTLTNDAAKAFRLSKQYAQDHAKLIGQKFPALEGRIEGYGGNYIIGAYAANNPIRVGWIAR